MVSFLRQAEANPSLRTADGLCGSIFSQISSSIIALDKGIVRQTTGHAHARSVLFFVRGGTIKTQNQMNGEIRDREIRVISETGEMLGVMSPREAMRLAEEADLDLVKISPNAVPPVCKIMDYGKFKFEQAKKEKENRRNQKVVEIKEVQLSMTIDVGDLNVKAKQATKFLGEGNKVKVSIRLRGRQMAHANLGRDVMNNFFEGLKEIAVIEKPINMEGRNIIMILAPKKS